MIRLKQVLNGLADTLEENSIPYMVIGAMAYAVWGESRTTADVDVAVWVPDADIPKVLKILEMKYRLLVETPAIHVEQSRHLAMVSPEGIRVDVLFGSLPFEREAIERAKAMPFDGRPLPVCTVEDLILYKIISDREKDQSDVRGIALRRMKGLDLEYLEPRIREFADLMGKPSILQLWEDLKREPG